MKKVPPDNSCGKTGLEFSQQALGVCLLLSFSLYPRLSSLPSSSLSISFVSLPLLSPTFFSPLSALPTRLPVSVSPHSDYFCQCCRIKSPVHEQQDSASAIPSTALRAGRSLPREQAGCLVTEPCKESKSTVSTCYSPSHSHGGTGEAGGYLDFRGLCTLMQRNWALTLCWSPDQSVHSSLEMAEGGRREDPVLFLHHK